MWWQVVLMLALVMIGFLAYVSTRSGQFRYERSAWIEASPEEIWPLISDLRRGKEWSPYEQKDPRMKSELQGEGNTVGSKVHFSGNKEAGSGILSITGLRPFETVDLHLTMTSPIKAENDIQYKLAREGTGTRMTWAMCGDGGFMGKLVNVFINCEKLVAKDMEKGLENLQALFKK